MSDAGFADFYAEYHRRTSAADLAGADLPQPAIEFSGRLLGEHLDALGLARAVTIEPTASVPAALERMGSAEKESLSVLCAHFQQ